jgi:predicted PilT family ATPase
MEVVDVPETAPEDFKYEQEGGKYTAKVYVDEPLFPFLIGRQGQKIKEMQSSTGCTINIPRNVAPGQQQQQQQGGANPNIARSHMITLSAPDLASLQRGYTTVQQTIRDALSSR